VLNDLGETLLHYFAFRFILRSCLSISLVGFFPEPLAARMLSHIPRWDMEPSARLISFFFIAAFPELLRRPFALVQFRFFQSQHFELAVIEIDRLQHISAT
jgi:hypothetical protein